MARAKAARKTCFKREITYESIQQSGKSFWITDPDHLEAGKEWIDNPPTKGYFEQYILADGQQIYVKLDMSIDDFEKAVQIRAVNKASINGKFVVDSGYIAMCNSRHKLLEPKEKDQAIKIEDWTGKLHSRVYNIEVDDQGTCAYYIVEGCRSNRGCDNFIIVPLRMFDDLKLV